MKYLRKIISLLSLTGLLAFSSCMDGSDDDFLYAGPIYMGYATVDKSITTTGDPILRLDDGTSMEIWEYSDAKASEIKKLPEYSRIYAYFFILDSEKNESQKHYMIQLNAYDEILTKKPEYNSLTSEETVGNDPINVDKSWFGGGFLNVDFHFFANNSTIKHLINLYVIEDHPDADENNIYVELRHNAYLDSPYFSNKGTVAFNIREFLPEGQNSIMVHFSHKNYSNKRITYSEAYSRKDTIAVDIQ